MPNNPAAPSSGHRSRGNSLVRSISSARGAMRSRAKRRTCSRTASSSSPRPKSKSQRSKTLIVLHPRRLPLNVGLYYCPTIMPVLETKVDRKSAEYAANAAALRALAVELRARQAKVALGGGEAARAKHLARGKLLPRDRVEMLLDPGSPFLELSPLAAYGMYDG